MKEFVGICGARERESVQDSQKENCYLAETDV